MLGSSGVGKTALTYQFTTSEYICAYDLSLDDDYGQKTVSVLLNGQETDLEVVDHPACEMSVSNWRWSQELNLNYWFNCSAPSVPSLRLRPFVQRIA